jgi:hypothetical protein
MAFPVSPDQFSPRETWSSLAPYVASPLAASAAIVPAFYDTIAKTAMQKGVPVPQISALQAIKGGVGAAPTVGAIVGVQMVLQGRVEKALEKTFPNLFGGDSTRAKVGLTLASSAIVGGISSPFLAVYNGKTMVPPWSFKESLSKFSPKIAGAIVLQETGFVAGLAAADLVSIPMKKLFGDNKAVEYLAAATAGALGSLVGHAGNTALTRWQSGMVVDNISQLSWGALRKARANAVFSVAYKVGKEALTPRVVEESVKK